MLVSVDVYRPAAREQLKGAEVTARSDIYSLGLVLYELFTGKRPFDGKTVRHMLELQEAAQLTSMTSIAADIDPAVEKVIRRCLDPDPAKRPATPLSVLAALPGGDPLAAALAAGETPSPEMVAASGETEGLAHRYSIPCLVAIVLCLFAATLVRGSRDAMMHAPLDYSPEMLAMKSRELAAGFGYARRPADTTVWLNHRSGLLDYLAKLPRPRKWDEWLASESPIMASYRESLEPMVAQPKGVVSDTNPPPLSPGMIYARLDGAARLREFTAVPYGAGDELKEPVGPEAVFRAAGLDISKFAEAAPEYAPPVAADRVRAWKGPHPKIPGMELRVQSASFQGRITHARILFPWDKINNAGGQGQSLAATLRQVYPLIIITILLLFAALVSRRNWKLGRTDRRGALLIAAASFVLDMAGWIGEVHAVPSDDMVGLFQRAAGEALFSAAIVWVVYLALEPAVRARWPHSIVTWNRILAGRWLDPLVGSHILIGAAAGSAIWMIFSLLEPALGPKDVLGVGGSLYVALGARQWLAVLAFISGHAITIGLVGFFAIFGLRQLLRKDWVAAIVAAVLFTFFESGVTNSNQVLVMAAVYLSVYAILIFMLLRFGLVATISSVCFINGFNALLLGPDWKTWYAPSGVATLLLMLGLAFVAFWRSLGSRGLLGNEDEAGA
ncbi:MAG: protein kinase [Acidobacteriia bacterium]|nr:protein kinase [Terriglobia bacterium]